MNNQSVDCSRFPQAQEFANTESSKANRSSTAGSQFLHSSQISINHNASSNQMPSPTPLFSSAADTLHTDDLEDEADSLSLKVRSLTCETFTSYSVPKPDSFDEQPSMVPQNKPVMVDNHLVEIEKENASLRAELHLINADRASLHQVCKALI